MEKVSQAQILDYCLKQKIPFAIYQLPKGPKPVLIVSKTANQMVVDELFKANLDMFVMAPFFLSQQKIIGLVSDFVIGEDVDADVFEEIKKINSYHEEVFQPAFCASYTDYKKQFETLYTQIASGRISKAILSRIKHLSDINSEFASGFFYKLCQAYPKAYSFMVYTPQSGIWTGASPELLFKAVDGVAKAVSLAGTKKSADDDKEWGVKERMEHQLVSDYVSDVLAKYDIENVVVKGPDTVQAGNMLHLKTQYQFGTEKIADQLGSFVNALHPTPAVCGLPKQESMQIIKEVEQHERTFYAGFLGRIKPNDIRLFVNIRSMKFVNDGVNLYLGGGITSGSEPEKEWNETELKAQTLWSVIQKVKGMKKA